MTKSKWPQERGLKLNVEYSLSSWTNSLLFMKPHVGNAGFKSNPKLLLLCNKPTQNLGELNSNHFLLVSVSQEFGKGSTWQF